MSTNDSIFQIVRLEGYSDKSGNNLVVVRDTWIEDCDDSDNFKVKYIGSSSNEEDDQAIREFVENPLINVPSGWPEFICYPQAVACTYNEALLILSSLKKSDALQSAKKIEAKPKPAKKNAKMLSDQTNVNKRVTATNGSIITSVVTSNLEMNLKSFPNMEVFVEHEGEELTVPNSLPNNLIQENNNTNNEYENGLFNEPIDKGSLGQGSCEGSIESLAEQANSKAANVTKKKNAGKENDESSGDEATSNKGFRKYVIRKLKSLDRGVKAVSGAVSNVAANLQETKGYVMEQRLKSDLVDIVTFDEFCAKSGFVMPLKEMEDFERFNQALTDGKNPEIRESLIKYLQSNITTVGDIEKNIRLILRKFITKTVGSNVTAKKHMPPKIVLNDTEFGKILRDNFVKCYNNADVLDERKFLKGMGNILNNVKDWDKGRNST